MRTQKEITKQMSDLAETMHTPGPWIATSLFMLKGEPKILICKSPGGVPATAIALAQCEDKTTKEMEANARLIAAAPAMLKALEEIERCIHPSVGGALGAIRKHALAAIAAAKRGV